MYAYNLKEEEMKEGDIFLPTFTVTVAVIVQGKNLTHKTIKVKSSHVRDLETFEIIIEIIVLHWSALS